MDEKGFIRFLKDKEKKSTGYVNAVTKFERFLCKHFMKSLEEANKNDLRACTVLTTNRLYP